MRDTTAVRLAAGRVRRGDVLGALALLTRQGADRVAADEAKVIELSEIRRRRPDIELREAAMRRHPSVLSKRGRA